MRFNASKCRSARSRPPTWPPDGNCATRGAHHFLGHELQAPPGREREHLRLGCALEEIQPLERLRHRLADDEHAVIGRASAPTCRRARAPSARPRMHRRRDRCNRGRTRCPRRSRARSAPPSRGADSRAWRARSHKACGCAARSAPAAPSGARACEYRAPCPRSVRGRSHLAVEIHHHEIARPDLRPVQPEGREQEPVGMPRHEHRHVVVDALVQTEVIRQPIAGGQIDARLALVDTDLRLALMSR